MTRGYGPGGASGPGGYVVMAFAAVGVYLVFGMASQATGGAALPLGKPILRG